MRQCAWCAQEMLELSATCEHCGRHTGEGVAADVSGGVAPELGGPPASSVSEPVGTIPEVASAGAKRVDAPVRRHGLLVVVLGVSGAGMLMLALLMLRGASPEVVTAHMDPAAPTQVPHGNAQLASVAAATWSTANLARWTGNQRKSAAFELPAENRVPIWLRTVQPVLVVRCLSNTIDVFVFTDTAARIEPDTEDHTVRIGFDDEAELTERWPDSADHDALFAPDGAAFARRLIHARTLRFGFTPHNAPPVVARFHVDGLGELIAPASRDCGGFRR